MVDIVLPENRRGRKSKEFKKKYEQQLQNFADALMELDSQMSDKVSSRGWCYLLEGMGLISKDQFDYAQKIINRCRKRGYLPVDFVELDEARDYINVEPLAEGKSDPKVIIRRNLDWVLECENDVRTGFWETQDVYIQMLVEKVDVRNLFKSICSKYHIPIANARGWSSILSRAQLAERFKKAEELGLKPILMYYADFDPAGLLIADKLKKNLRDLRKATGWDPKNLVVDRFGLTFDFINQNNLMWIDNLTTGSGRRADDSLDYVSDYIEKYGRRKCEANAILPKPDIAINHCEKEIQKWLGDNPFETYDKELKAKKKQVKELKAKLCINRQIKELKNSLLNGINSNLDLNFSESKISISEALEAINQNLDLDLGIELDFMLSGLKRVKENPESKSINVVINRLKKLTEVLD
ncbi:MAG: hypothetical protein R6U96_18655 [Promethearchaeia archaeon]